MWWYFLGELYICSKCFFHVSLFHLKFVSEVHFFHVLYKYVTAFTHSHIHTQYIQQNKISNMNIPNETKIQWGIWQIAFIIINETYAEHQKFVAKTKIESMMSFELIFQEQDSQERKFVENRDTLQPIQLNNG